MKNFNKIMFIIILIIIGRIDVYAHPGRTNENNCHVCRTNCDSWGYAYDLQHCHTDTVPKYSPSKPDYSYKNEDNSKTSNRLGLISENNEEDFYTKYSSQIESVLVILPYFIVAGFSYFLESSKKKK